MTPKTPSGGGFWGSFLAPSLWGAKNGLQNPQKRGFSGPPAGGRFWAPFPIGFPTKNPYCGVPNSKFRGRVPGSSEFKPPLFGPRPKTVIFGTPQ